jgi:hypothetical protein
VSLISEDNRYSVELRVTLLISLEWFLGKGDNGEGGRSMYASLGRLGGKISPPTAVTARGSPTCTRGRPEISSTMTTHSHSPGSTKPRPFKPEGNQLDQNKQSVTLSSVRF